ncbi:unnamed protein product, partial [marine sediment metagenome]
PMPIYQFEFLVRKKSHTFYIKTLVILHTE